MLVSELFEAQCLDSSSHRLCTRMLTDPSWDHDPNGLLVHRSTTGEISLHVPPTVPRPCAVICPTPAVTSAIAASVTTADAHYPLAEDGFVLSEGVGDSNTVERNLCFGAVPCSPAPIRLLTRNPPPQAPHTYCNPHVGLAILTTPTEPPLIPTGRELAVEAISNDGIRQAKVTDPDCQRFLTATARAGL
jgi:hypothetical protein